MGWLENHFEKKNKSKKSMDKVKTVMVIGLNYSPPI